MLYIILLAILAVLLFGSSAVLGAFGWMMGLIVALVAIVWANIAFGVPVELWVAIGLGLIAIVGVAHYALQAKIEADEAVFKQNIGAHADATSKEAIDRRAKYQAVVDAARRARIVEEAEPMKVSEEYRKAYASIQFRQRVKEDMESERGRAGSRSESAPLLTVEHDFSTYSRDVPREIGSRKFCRNHTEVAGLQMRRADALRYIEGAVEADVHGRPHGLRLDREPTNPFDPNAVRVTGWWGSQRAFLGYVPKGYAVAYAKIADSGGELMAVPKRAYRGHDDYVDVRFVIYGINPA